MNYQINDQIDTAETLPAAFYRNREQFADVTNTLFSAAWIFAGDIGQLDGQHNVVPFHFLPHVINEPLVFTRNDQGEIKCLSNVCTHRGNLLVTHKGKHSKLLCSYHGRRFDLDGTFEYMPEFEKARGFPRPCDHLTEVPLRQWRQFLFVGLEPRIDFDGIVAALEERIGFLPVEDYQFDTGRSKTYEVKAHWALYCDNYLEGFHIPYVHPGLNKAVDFGQYETVLYEGCNLQIGYSRDAGTRTFELPAGHPDHGKQVAAYYYWIFPNLMLNFYPWGLSVNVVEPIGPGRTRISFLSYVGDAGRIADSAGEQLDQVEMEDEAVVESVQQGIHSRYYSTGRFSPTYEQGVHHFHRLIARMLQS